MKYKLIYNIHKAWRKCWKSVFLLSVLIVGACSDNTYPEPVDTEDPDISSLDTAYISLSTDLNSYAITRGYEGEAGISEEDFVEKVRIVFYDGEQSNSKVVKCFDFAIRTNSGGTNAWIDESTEEKDLAPTTSQSDKSKFITYARKVPAMDLKMLVIINTTTEFKTLTEEGREYKEIIEKGTKIEKSTSKSNDVGGLAKTNYFLMTSGPGLISVPKDKLKATVREAHNAPVSATVSRVVSKVTVVSSDGKDTFPTKNNATVGDIQWELDITNRYTYWITQGQLNGNREDWYWPDPNYSGYGSKSFNDLQDDFFYFASTGESYPNFKKRLKEAEYCLENTMDETDQNSNNVITRVLIRCAYKPANVKNMRESFYVYKNSTYSIEDMKGFAQEAENLEENVSDFCKAIKEASGDGYSFLTGKPEKNGKEVSESFTVKGITYYYKGINYYAVKIRHRGTNDTTTGYGHYGVLRNTHYTVAIEKIEGPGSPGILSDGIVTRSINSEDNRLYNNIESSIQIQ